MLTLKQLMSECLVHASTPEEFELSSITPMLEKFNFAVIRGIVSETEVLNAKKLVRQEFDASRDRPATGETPQDLKTNFQKLSIGGAEQSGVYRPRCMRSLYNSPWAEDIYGMKDIFRRMAKIRNLVYGFDINFAVDEVENKFWTASRIHHYPSGGDFWFLIKITLSQLYKQPKVLIVISNLFL